MRSMVEGAHVRAARDNSRQHCIQVTKHIRRGNAHDGETFAPKNGVPCGVTPGLVTAIVPFPVNLNDQPPLQTGEVRSNLANRELPAKPQPIRTPSEHLPEKHLRQRHLSPKPACALYLLGRCLEDAWAPSTTQLC